jgi:hypothetical protein
MDKGVAAKEVIEEWWFRSDLEDCACQGPNVRSEASKKASRESGGHNIRWLMIRREELPKINEENVHFEKRR